MKTFVIAGKSDIAVEALLYLIFFDGGYARDFELAVLPSASDLKEHGWQKSLQKAAGELGIPVHASFHSLEECYDRDNTYIFSLEYDRLIKSGSFPKKNLFNIHFSALPMYRGVYTSIFPILQGERTSGVTLHYIDDGIDTGPIISQRLFSIEGMTAWDLYKKYNSEGIRLFIENYKYVTSAKEVSSSDQNGGWSCFYRKDLDFELRRLDAIYPYMSALEIDRHFRGFFFPVYQMPLYRGKSVTSLSIIDEERLDSPRELFGCNDYVLLACKRGAVLLSF